MVDTEILIFGYLAHLESPLPASECLAMGIHKPGFKTTLNVCFQKCKTHRVDTSVHCLPNQVS